VLSMKQIKGWSVETASRFECRCGACHGAVG
jgi:hypothetical protein